MKFRWNVTACWFGIIFFLIIGIRSICLAYAIHGIDFVSISFWAILRDPIYLYACLDLGAIFGIISYWCFKTKQGSKRSLILWIPGFFVFGTPAFLLYLLTYKNRPTDKSTPI